MKKLYKVIVLLFLLTSSVYAQNNVGINTSTPDASAALDVASTNQGMLVPRMNKAQRDAINQVSGLSTPATGLLIYQTDNTPGFYFYNGSSWASLNGTNGSSGSNGQGFSNGTAAGQIYLTGASSPYSPLAPATVTGDVTINSSAVTSISNNVVTTSKLNDGAVTTGKIANASITTGKISATGTASATTYLRGDGSWSSPQSSNGPVVDLVVRKLATSQVLPLSTAAADIVKYENIVTSPSVGSYSTTTNAYTVGTAGVYIIQTHNTVVPVSPINNQVGAYNWIEVNEAAIGSFNNFYPTYVTNGSQGGVTPVAIKSSTSYLVMLYLNTGDVIKVRATGLNSGVQQTLSNEGGTQLMIVKL